MRSRAIHIRLTAWLLAASAVLACRPTLAQQPSSPAAPAVEPAKPAAKTKADYMEVPLIGEFGKEILAGGVKKALIRAKAEQIQHIVFVVDSGGGVVEDAKAIAEVLKQFDGSFTYHAVIKKAFSASLWVLTLCDNWYCSPGGATGAAVVYSLSTQSGAAEVDAKMNGAVAAMLASAAEQKGHSGDAIRAMVLMDAKLYFNPAANDQASRLSAVQQPGAVEIDTDRTVLSASMAQMVEWGLAINLPDAANPCDAVGKALGKAEWRSSGNGGVGAMKSTAAAFAAAMAERDRAYKQFQEATKAMSEAAKSFDYAFTAAGTFDPSRVQLIRDQYGKITSESSRQYNAAIDGKVARLNDAVAAARGIATAQANAKRAASAYESAHLRAADTAGLEPSHLRREAVETPEVPKDFQALAARAADDAVTWRKQRRN